VADLNSVLFERIFPQMCSANTFARKVVEKLRGIYQSKRSILKCYIPAIG
jgi:hypothetical protein